MRVSSESELTAVKVKGGWMERCTYPKKPQPALQRMGEEDAAVEDELLLMTDEGRETSGDGGKVLGWEKAGDDVSHEEGEGHRDMKPSRLTTTIEEMRWYRTAVRLRSGKARKVDVEGGGGEVWKSGR